MSLNNKQMLPDRIRNMRQMSELLNVEDIVLVEIEQMVNEMYQRASLLHKERINERWLEEKLGKLVDGTVDVKKEEGKLSVEITLNTGKIAILYGEDVIRFIEKWLPAHLAYHVISEKTLKAEVYFSCLWQDDEIMILKEVKV